MEVARVVAHGLGQRIEEGDDIVPDPLLQPGDMVGIDPGLPKPIQRRPGDLSDLGPGLTNRELDPQP